MKHCGTQQLETERLILRRFRPKDAAAMFNNWASDDEVYPSHTTNITCGMEGVLFYLSNMHFPAISILLYG